MIKHPNLTYRINDLLFFNQMKIGEKYLEIKGDNNTLYQEQSYIAYLGKEFIVSSKRELAIPATKSMHLYYVNPRNVEGYY